MNDPAIRARNGADPTAAPSAGDQPRRRRVVREAAPRHNRSRWSRPRDPVLAWHRGSPPRASARTGTGLPTRTGRPRDATRRSRWCEEARRGRRDASCDEAGAGLPIYLSASPAGPGDPAADGGSTPRAASGPAVGRAAHETGDGPCCPWASRGCSGQIHGDPADAGSPTNGKRIHRIIGPVAGTVKAAGPSPPSAGTIAPCPHSSTGFSGFFRRIRSASGSSRSAPARCAT